MPTPFKIIVLADLCPGQEAGKPLSVSPEGVDGLMSELRPGLKLGDPLVDLVFTRLEDFTPPAVSKGRKNLEQDAAALSSVIHHPQFMALESAWRGLEFVAKHLPQEGVELVAVPTGKDDLRQTLYDKVFKPEYDGLTDTPAGMILLDFDLDHKPGSLEVMKDLAKMGAAIQAPVVAQTTASFFNLSHLLHVAALGDLTKRLEGPEYASYQGFRSQEEASWLGLCLNCFLLRPPFEGLAYSEPASASQPESYLWGRAIWILGANLARAWGSHGHPIGISGMGYGGEQSGLALRDLPLNRKESVQTPLEAVLPMPLVETLPYFGLSPLTQLPAELGGSQQPDVAYLHLAANLRHFTDPTGQQPGMLLVYATLAYSIILGRASNLGLRLLPEFAGMGPEQAAEGLAVRLKEELGAMAEGELEVTPQDGALAVSLKPKLLIHSKPFEVAFELPLR